MQIIIALFLAISFHPSISEDMADHYYGVAMRSFKESKDNCHIDDYHVVLSPGEQYSPVAECRQYGCHPGNRLGGGQLYVSFCTETALPAGCFRVNGDSTKPFPSCCSKTICPGRKPSTTYNTQSTARRELIQSDIVDSQLPLRNRMSSIQADIGDYALFDF